MISFVAFLALVGTAAAFTSSKITCFPSNLCKEFNDSVDVKTISRNHHVVNVFAGGLPGITSIAEFYP
jgi:hypothetical protein